MKPVGCVSALAGAALMVLNGAAAQGQNGPPAQAQREIVVDCNDGDSLQQAVDRRAASGGSTIFFTGECVEDVTITRDLITLNGDPNETGIRGGEGTVFGQITVQGADNVSLESLTATGGGSGIFVTDGGDVDISDSIADGNDVFGLLLTNAAVARVTATDITNNADFNFGFGLILQRASAVELRCDNVISGNGNDRGSQIWLEEGAALRQQGCDNDPDLDRDIIQARTDVFDPRAIFVFNNSNVDIRGADVDGQIKVHGAATFRVQSSLIQGDIENTVNSVVGFRPDATFNGTLTCDATSEVFGPLLNLNAVQCN